MSSASISECLIEPSLRSFSNCDSESIRTENVYFLKCFNKMGKGNKNTKNKNKSVTKGKKNDNKKKKNRKFSKKVIRNDFKKMAKKIQPVSSTVCIGYLYWLGEK